MRSGGFYPADKNCQTEQQQDKLQICQSERKPLDLYMLLCTGFFSFKIFGPNQNEFEFCVPIKTINSNQVFTNLFRETRPK